MFVQPLARESVGLAVEFSLDAVDLCESCDLEVRFEEAIVFAFCNRNLVGVLASDVWGEDTSCVLEVGVDRALVSEFGECASSPNVLAADSGDDCLAFDFEDGVASGFDLVLMTLWPCSDCIMLFTFRHA